MLQMKLNHARFVAWLVACSFLLSCEEDTPSGLQGKGGSLARFTLAKDHLYVVDNTSIKVFKIESNGAFTSVGQEEVGFGIETIHATAENLFLGASNAVYIYGLSDPSSPRYISEYTHITSCDPVVVQGDYAYASLRAGNCRFSDSDVLEVIDIRDLARPVKVSSRVVTSPYGLGVDGTLLFLCEGDQGLTVYDISDPKQIQVVGQYDSFHAHDVITNGGVLVLTGYTGIYQFDYSDPRDMRQLSHIPSIP